MSPTDWDRSPPPPVDLGDREVPRLGDHLVGRRVALLVTGGIAAMKAPLTARALRKHGATVVAFASPEALRYVAADALLAATPWLGPWTLVAATYAWWRTVTRIA